jgi:hypothetical protein
VKEALPIAELAYKLSQSALVADTLGWIHHLLGDNKSALPLIEQALAGNPKHAEILLHAAFIHAEVDRLRARQELDAAIQIDASLGDRIDVQKLRATLNRP